MVQYKNMVPLEMSKGTAAIINLGTTYQGDANANRVGVYVFEYEKSVTLSGQCAGICRRNDGQEVPLSGTVSGNMAYVTLDGNCYAAQGPITVLVKLVSGNDEITLAAAFGNVGTSGGTALIQPVEHLPDYAQLLAEISNMRTATAAANTAATNANGATGYIAPTEASSTASAAHAAGTYFVYGGVLYRATADIASGGSIVTSGSGQNCEAVTVGGELVQTKDAVKNVDNLVKSSIEAIGSAITITHQETVTADQSYFFYLEKPILRGTTFKITNTSTNAGFSLNAIKLDGTREQLSYGINRGSTETFTANYDIFGFRCYVNDTDWSFTLTYGPTGTYINNVDNLIKSSIEAIGSPITITHQESVTANQFHVFSLEKPILRGTTFSITNNSTNAVFNVYAIKLDGSEEKLSNGVSRGSTETFTENYDVFALKCYVNNTDWSFTLTYGPTWTIYYDAEIADTADKITAATREKSVLFAMMTDSHNLFDGWDNWTPTIKNLAVLTRKCSFDFIVHLGDIIEGNFSKSVSSGMLIQAAQDLRGLTDLPILLTGNHDDNCMYYVHEYEGLIGNADRYALLNRLNDAKVQRIGTERYFYFDFENQNMDIRVICLEGLLGDGYPPGIAGEAWGYTDAQVAWVRDTALDTDKQVVFLSHMPLSSIYKSSYERGYLVYNSEAMLAVIGAFVENGGTVIGFINGHTHADYIALNSIGIFEVQSGCQNMNVSGPGGEESYNDGAYTPYVPARTRNTVTQELWDAVALCPDGHTVRMIRFGAGSDRTIHYDGVTVTTTETLTSELSGTLTWTSSDTEVATVSGGTVTAAASGRCMITAKDTSGNAEHWKIVVAQT